MQSTDLLFQCICQRPSSSPFFHVNADQLWGEIQGVSYEKGCAILALVQKKLLRLHESRTLFFLSYSFLDWTNAGFCNCVGTTFRSPTRENFQRMRNGQPLGGRVTPALFPRKGCNEMKLKLERPLPPRVRQLKLS